MHGGVEVNSMPYDSALVSEQKERIADMDAEKKRNISAL
jgi:hypothetical protein